MLTLFLNPSKERRLPWRSLSDYFEEKWHERGWSSLVTLQKKTEKRRLLLFWPTKKEGNCMSNAVFVSRLDLSQRERILKKLADFPSGKPIYDFCSLMATELDVSPRVIGDFLRKHSQGKHGANGNGNNRRGYKPSTHRRSIRSTFHS